MPIRLSQRLRTALFATSALSFATVADATPRGVELPTNLYITPLAIRGAEQQLLNPKLPDYPNFIASEALLEAVSPDGKSLAIVTGGQNSLHNASGVTDTANSTQYIFIYDISGSNARRPSLVQVLKQPNANRGLVWSPDGNILFAAGGSDDAVYAYTKNDGVFSLTKTVPLGHAQAGSGGLGLLVKPETIGLAISADGRTLVAANNYNDSITVGDVASARIRFDFDLRPFNTSGTNGVAGGEYPFAVAINGNDAYVSSTRDREIVVVDISGTAGRLVKRIKLSGNPYGMVLRDGVLFVAEDNQDRVGLIDVASNSLLREIDVRAPAGMLKGPRYTGAAPYAVTLSPDSKTLYVVNNGANNIAVVPLTGSQALSVTGLIPTAYAPKDIAFSTDGRQMYIINGKSNTGPNPANLMTNTGSIQYKAFAPIPPGYSNNPAGILAANTIAAAASNAANQYQFQLEQASLISAPTPDAQQLIDLTEQVAKNNGYSARVPAADRQVMSFLRRRIKHVIYIIKENRTFDQILGDLKNGANADPSLVQFGRDITPNFHRISRQYVTLDNFFDPADGSMDGWSWSMRGRITNDEEVTQQQNYAYVNRGLSYETEGSNRNVPVGVADAARVDAVAPTTVNGTVYNYNTLSALLPGGTANLLPGPSDIAATDTVFGDEPGQQNGYIFVAAIKAGLSVRNYGFMVNNIGPTTLNGQPITNAGAAGIQQVAELHPALQGNTDLYFRGFDQNFSDQWNVNEWKREFRHYVHDNNLPAFETVRLSHDHTGNFATALAGVNTPETQEADNDLAIGRVLQTVSESPFAKSTLVFVIEDDSQDGPDHVDSHRATAYVAGAYVRQHAVVSTRYNQVNMLRTMEDILGTAHISLLTANAAPMADVFDISGSGDWSYTATASTILKTTTLVAANQTGIRYAAGPDIRPLHDAAWWAKKTAGFDFSVEDRVPTALFNRVLWEGTRPGVAYPRIAASSVVDKDD
ncbi:bifunctional YncE family protein/alkaline phosphatase family protein [Lichenicola cladoniae]|nr:bifunctional YncE family protein/alkaline phosphatase family protein [Lichenicola cladoniae]